jgi:hypothetical protein
MDDDHDKMVDGGTIKGQDHQWIKVEKAKKKLPTFNEWLKETKGVEDMISFGSTSKGIQILNRWRQEYDQLSGHVNQLKKMM